MTLALLLTAVTGAWATEPRVINSEIDFESLKVGDIIVEGFSMSGPKSVMFYFNAGRAKKGETLLNNDVGFYRYEISSVGTNAVITLSADAGDAAGTYTPIDENGQVANAWIVTSTNGSGNSDFHLSGYKYVAPNAEPAEAPITVAWDAATKTGTFAMPGSDVVLTPIYAKAAAFATTGTEPEVKTLLPEAAEGVIAGTDASLIAEGTGIVAFAAASTDVKQGTLMYAIGTSATEAPALTDFSATVPTAKDIADDGATVYVWYYIQGADAPDGEAATLDNTFDNTEPACLTVQVLTNKFDIQFNAANANTIEAGRATVTVGGTAATVTEGKLQGVKMGSEVKVKANTGYKFRKVEVKKAAAAPSLNITNPVVGQVIGSDGKNYAADATLPSGVTAVAMIAYVGSETDDTDYTGGLAIALSDEGRMNWSTAKSTCEGKTAVTGAKWCLPSQNQWKAMFKANGGSESSYTGLNTAISTAGGTALQKSCYWSSTEHGEVNAYYVYLFSGNAYFSNASKGIDYLVRAVLAF